MQMRRQQPTGHLVLPISLTNSAYETLLSPFLSYRLTSALSSASEGRNPWAIREAENSSAVIYPSPFLEKQSVARNEEARMNSVLTSTRVQLNGYVGVLNSKVTCRGHETQKKDPSSTNDASTARPVLQTASQPS